EGPRRRCRPVRTGLGHAPAGGGSRGRHPRGARPRGRAGADRPRRVRGRSVRGRRGDDPLRGPAEHHRALRALRPRADSEGHVRRRATRAPPWRRPADPEAVGQAFAELGEAHGQHPPVPFETVAAWAKRARLSSAPSAFLEALIQIQPSIPLRYVDAHTLHLGPEVFMQIAGGNDQLPHRIAEGLDVRLGQPVRTIGWSGPGVTVETESETLSGDLVVVAVPGPLTTELGWDPPLPPEKVGALVSLRYGTGAGVGIQYAETHVVREAIRTGIFTDRLPNWFLDVSAYQSGQPIVVVTILSGERQPRGMDESAVLEEADRTMEMVTGSPVTRTFGAVANWTDDPYSRCIARAPIGDQRETLLPPIRAPLGRSVFFAGEHTDGRPGPGGMEGAIKSAYRVVTEILEA